MSKAMDNDKAPKSERTYATQVSNAEVVEGAGSVKMEEGRLWGKAIIHEFRETVGTWWVKDMTTFNQRTIAVSLLLFLTAFAPTVTFGAVYGKVTDNRIGAVETIIATSWVGVAYSLIGGMPMCIIGSTGPVLALTRAIISICNNMDVPYLTFNVWVSLWLVFYTILSGLFDFSRVVRMCTRFTDEVFALLIVSIFVLDAVGDPFSDVGILRQFDPNHKAHEDNADEDDYSYLEVALLGTLIGFGTTALIFFFRTFKTSPFFCSQGIRNSIYDFSVIIAVIVGTLVKEVLFPSIDTESLNVPDKFEPTFQCCDSTCTTFWPDQCEDLSAPAGSRPWFVDWFDFNGKGYVPIVAAGPAVLAFLLCYLDSGITWHLVNHPNNKLQHGEAYNYDLILVGIFNFINSLLGLPWLVATTVPCIVHLNALSDKDKDGRVISVQENRLTAFFAHLLIGLSLLALELLQLLPMPVLYGVFLFMGLSALPSIQFWHRFLMFFQQPSCYADTPYNRYMEKGRVHMYTCFEIFFFGLIFLTQNFQAISIVFPFMTLLCIPARVFLLPKFFEGWELCLLDGDDNEIDEWLDARKAANSKVAFADSDSLEDSA